VYSAGRPIARQVLTFNKAAAAMTPTTRSRATLAFHVVRRELKLHIEISSDHGYFVVRPPVYWFILNVVCLG
jgi:hypothetical protein